MDHLTAIRLESHASSTLATAHVELTKVALGFLGRAMSYEVPRQDLRISLSRMPAIPKSGFLIRKVRRR